MCQNLWCQKHKSGETSTSTCSWVQANVKFVCWRFFRVDLCLWYVRKRCGIMIWQRKYDSWYFLGQKYREFAILTMLESESTKMDCFIRFSTLSYVQNRIWKWFRGGDSRWNRTEQGILSLRRFCPIEHELWWKSRLSVEMANKSQFVVTSTFCLSEWRNLFGFGWSYE